MTEQEKIQYLQEQIEQCDREISLFLNSKEILETELKSLKKEKYKRKGHRMVKV